MLGVCGRKLKSLAQPPQGRSRGALQGGSAAGARNLARGRRRSQAQVRGGGSQRYHQLHAHLRSGPGSIPDFMQWPDHMIDALCSPRGASDAHEAQCRLRRLHSNMAQPGLVCHSDYSGMQCPEMALRMSGVALHDFLLKQGFVGMPGGHRPDWLVSWRACDNDPVCQWVISGGQWAPEHLLPDIGARMPLDVRQRLLQLRPPPHAAETAKREAFAAMSSYLESEAVFAKLSAGMWVSRCLSHPGRRCPIAWSRTSFETRGANGSPGPGCRHPILMNVSGPTCLPWTAFGSRQGHAHMASEPFMLWALEMQKFRYDVVFMENSSSMPRSLLSAKMQASAETVGVVFSPHEIGWPVQRSRLMLAAIDRSHLVWLGPDPQDADAPRRHFMGFFARHTEVDANIFANADTPANVLVERTRRACNAGLDSMTSQSACVADFFKTERQRGYARRYMRMLQARAGPRSGTMVCDMSQNPKHPPRCSPWLPSPTRNSNFCLLSKNEGERNKAYFFTPAELMLMMGWPTIAGAGGDKYMGCANFQISDLSVHELRKLQGNSIHLASVGCFMAWVFAHCLRRDVVREFLPSLTSLGAHGLHQQQEGEEQEGAIVGASWQE